MRPRANLSVEELGDRILPSAVHLFAVGQDIDGTSEVQVYRADGSADYAFNPFAQGFTGGVRVTTGDVTGSGQDDIIVAAGAGGGPVVQVYSGATGALMLSFYTYDPAYTGGINLAVGDVSGSGRADIIVGTGIGGGPNVRVYDGITGSLMQSFYAYEPTFQGGVNVAAADLTGSGYADIVTGTGVGGGPRVKVFDGKSGNVLGDFFAYDSSLRNGVTVAAGDVLGTGKADIITGIGAGAGPNVRLFDGVSDAPLSSFYAYGTSFNGGVAVGVAYFNDAYDILTTPGPSAGGYAELFNGTTQAPVGYFRPFPNFQGGVTTGESVATLAAPLNSTFAPVVPFPMSAGTPFIGGSSDVTGNGVSSTGDVFGGGDNGN